MITLGGKVLNTYDRKRTLIGGSGSSMSSREYNGQVEAARRQAAAVAISQEPMDEESQKMRSYIAAEEKDALQKVKTAPAIEVDGERTIATSTGIRTQADERVAADTDFTTSEDLRTQSARIVADKEFMPVVTNAVENISDGQDVFNVKAHLEEPQFNELPQQYRQPQSSQLSPQDSGQPQAIEQPQSSEFPTQNSELSLEQVKEIDRKLRDLKKNNIIISIILFFFSMMGLLFRLFILFIIFNICVIIHNVLQLSLDASHEVIGGVSKVLTAVNDVAIKFRVPGINLKVGPFRINTPDILNFNQRLFGGIFTKPIREIDKADNSFPRKASELIILILKAVLRDLIRLIPIILKGLFKGIVSIFK